MKTKTSVTRTYTHVKCKDIKASLPTYNPFREIRLSAGQCHNKNFNPGPQAQSLQLAARLPRFEINGAIGVRLCQVQALVGRRRMVM